MMIGLIALMLHGFLFQTIPQSLQTGSGSCTQSSIQNCFTSIYDTWFAIAGIAAVAILAIVILVYAVFRLVGRSDVATWARVKVYDVALALILIIVFAYVVNNLLYTFPIGFLNTALGIVPQFCQNSLYNIYSLSTCDMYTYNNFTARYDNEQYKMFLLLGTIQPEIAVEWSSNPVSAAGGWNVQLTGDLQLISQNVLYKYLGGGIDLIYGFFLANELQLIVLSSAALIFAILMALGLVARIFGISRTFGGAMIAFALGLGILYPMLTILNYGFINVGIQNIYPSAIQTGRIFFGVAAVTGSSGKAAIGALAAYSGIYAINYASCFFGGTSGCTNIANVSVFSVFIYWGLIWIGLTFIPLLTLVIVDVFIIDFSQAIGERMDLLSMLVRIL